MRQPYPAPRFSEDARAALILASATDQDEVPVGVLAPVTPEFLGSASRDGPTCLPVLGERSVRRTSADDKDKCGSYCDKDRFHLGSHWFRTAQNDWRSLDSSNSEYEAMLAGINLGNRLTRRTVWRRTDGGGFAAVL